MRWQTKARAFSVLSNIPWGEDLHYALQRYVTRRLPRPERQVRSIYTLAQRLLGVHDRYSIRPLRDSTFYEFGAGRDLIIPLAFSAHGARRFITVDIERLAKLELIRANAAVISRLSGTDHPDLNSVEDLERYWHIDYRAPADARTTGLPAGSIDCAVSVETLEHIPKSDIAAILKELRRIMRPDGLILMQIDYGDHFKGFDPSISSFNFLTYSDEDWAPFQSRFQYVNRLRHSEYLQLFREAGFELLSDQPDRRPPEQQILERLAPRFRNFSPEDLFTLGSLIVGRPTDLPKGN
ncbi:methyltransferase domain-containing protein [Bradyrhizobium yuanmingense]|uniref:class I SAM-dependent methyltransferase n=1 Tax=Bradyrhizobium yuanmingense TaxID=108015 RepID=UPI00187D4D0A|nr:MULTISPECIES: class I SAM-dependent methyltransferase [Bradyrhizobium]UWU82567.1 methyltransferase domain-containing protein [Bradyrhizobium sp. CB1024]